MLSFRVQFSRSLMVIGRRVRVKLFPIYDVAVKFSLGNYFSSNNGGLRFTCQILSKTILKGWHTYTILYIILKFVKFSDFPFKYDERLLLRAGRGIWLWIINFFSTSQSTHSSEISIIFIKYIQYIYFPFYLYFSTTGGPTWHRIVNVRRYQTSTSRCRSRGLLFGH